MFNAFVLPVHDIIMKIDCMFLSWFSTTTEDTQESLVVACSTIHRSLEFIGHRMETARVVITTEEIQDGA